MPELKSTMPYTERVEKTIHSVARIRKSLTRGDIVVPDLGFQLRHMRMVLPYPCSSSPQERSPESAAVPAGNEVNRDERTFAFDIIAQHPHRTFCVFPDE